MTMSAFDETALRGILAGHPLTPVSRGKRPPSAVLVPLLKAPDGWSVLFEVRSADIVQGGEICFPGGAIEPGEAPEEAARRETCEELKLREEQIEVLAPLHRIAGPGGSDLTSFAALLHGYAGTWSPDEVDHIFTLPLTWLRDHPPQTATANMVFENPDDFPYDKIPGGRDYPWQPVPRTYYFYDTPHDECIWGITGELLFHFLELLPD
ncbi:MAG: CoA pyrophosphatase [Clostridia bacterium]|nr:CoA pyrophosphatase [Clostridia bacterium]